jgi:glycosyltransferase involved in cell wall biosynthesis
MTRLAIVCTHPIQYFAPVFAELARRPGMELKAFYGWRGATAGGYDPGFGQSVQWDVPLLDGYEYEFVPNTAKTPGSHHYRGIQLPTLNSRITEWRADAVLVYGWCYHSHLNCMRFFKNKLPVFFRGDSTLMQQPSGIKKFARSVLLRWVYRHVDTAFFVGSQNKTYFQAFGLKEQQLVFAPHAIDNERFANSADDEQGLAFRRAQGVADEDVVILLPAKLEPIKNPGLLLDAFEALANPKCHLFFAGSGPLENALRLRGHANVHFLGFRNQSQMPAIYRAADLVVLPSRSESWGLALNEAMACGRAVLASDSVGAAVDLVQRGQNGWIVRANEFESLVEQLQAAISHGRSGLSAFGDRSRQLISNWTIPAQADAIAITVKDLTHA